MPARRADRSPADAGRVLAALDRRAPLRHAAEWDNVGLLLGRADWPARRALLAIDLTDAVAREALQRRCDLLLLYHPPIFKGLKRVTTDADGPTSLLPDLLAARIGAIALHTALDAAPGGTNDVLLDALDVVERWPLETLSSDGRQCKLVVFVPSGEVDRLRAALSAVGAGVIGRYEECAFSLPGRGSFRGDETTNPTIGRAGRLEHVDEVRLEMVAPASRMGTIVRALYATHSYEEPAFDIYPLRELPGRATVGMGRVGRLRRPQRGAALLRQLAGVVDLRAATVIGDLRRSFDCVVAAAGSFGPRALREAGGLVLTGELKHHESLELLRAGVTAICLGHWASERPVLSRVKEWLRADLPGLKVDLSRADRAPAAALNALERRGGR